MTPTDRLRLVRTGYGYNSLRHPGCLGPGTPSDRRWRTAAVYLLPEVSAADAGVVADPEERCLFPGVVGTGEFGASGRDADERD